MATKPKMMAKKKSLFLTKEDLHQDKLLIKSIIIKEKQIPVKAMKLSSGPKSKEVSLKTTSKVRRKKTNTLVMRKSVNPQVNLFSFILLSRLLHFNKTRWRSLSPTGCIWKLTMIWSSTSFSLRIRNSKKKSSS